MKALDNTTRRTLIAGSLAAFGLNAISGLAGAEPAVAGETMTKKNFVLVHGAWHGGWCWRRVSDLLQRKGHRVFSPTLTGLGERSHQLQKGIGISAHITDICDVLTWEDLNNVVLVGHSYGGIVVSGVAERATARLSSIVFLDSFMPANGQALIDFTPPAMNSMIREMAARGDLALAGPPSTAFGISDEDRAWVESKMTPQPIGTFIEKSEYTGARDKIGKKAYIRASAYPNPTFDGHLAQVKSDPSWKSFEMATGHDAMITAPSELVKILLAVA